MDAHGDELVRGQVPITEFAHLLHKLPRDIMCGEGEQLVERQARIAETFHLLDVFLVRREAELAGAFPVAEPAVEDEVAGVAAQLEMRRRIFSGSQLGVQALEFLDFMPAAPTVGVIPTRRAKFEIERSPLRP